MNLLTTTVARIIFALPFGIFGLFHLFQAQNMVGMVPTFVPGGVLWVYLTGIALLAACIAIIANVMAYAASIGLALLLTVFVILIHIPALTTGENVQLSMVNFLKDASLIGGALLVAGVSRGNAS